MCRNHLMDTKIPSAQKRYNGKPDPCGNAQILVVGI
tara:strand:+ start:4142 stop:4249 length:108 start_codon:yes stop_codon:yes gene_type:complete